MNDEWFGNGGVQQFFHGLAFFRAAGAAKMRLEFEAVKDGRIMAGGDHHATDRAKFFYCEGNAGRRRGFWRENDLKPVSVKNFGGDPRKTVGQKAAVVANDNFQPAPKNL